jgi:hypothetical protein
LCWERGRPRPIAHRRAQFLFLAAKRRTGTAGGPSRPKCAIAGTGAIQMYRSTLWLLLDRSFIFGAVLPAGTAGGPSKKPCFISIPGIGSMALRQTSKLGACLRPHQKLQYLFIHHFSLRIKQIVSCIRNNLCCNLGSNRIETLHGRTSGV